MRPPDDPIAAITHPDPYPYYAELVARRPLYHDGALGLWSRPARRPSRRCSAASWAASGQSRSRSRRPGWARRPDILAVDVVASLLGVAEAHLAKTAAWVGDFVACLAPGSSPEQVASGTTAAGISPSSSRVCSHARSPTPPSPTRSDISQAYEATAGLGGNTLVALGRELETARRLDGDPGLLRAIVREVVRFDPRRRLLAAAPGYRASASSRVPLFHAPSAERR